MSVASRAIETPCGPIGRDVHGDLVGPGSDLRGPGRVTDGPNDGLIWSGGAALAVRVNAAGLSIGGSCSVTTWKMSGCDGSAIALRNDGCQFCSSSSVIDSARVDAHAAAGWNPALLAPEATGPVRPEWPLRRCQWPVRFPAVVGHDGVQSPGGVVTVHLPLQMPPQDDPSHSAR
jgi:hypothetical protein